MNKTRLIASVSALRACLSAAAVAQKERSWIFSDISGNKIAWSCSGEGSPPELFALYEDTVRHALLRRFPYAVYYEALPDRPIVHAVLHAKRHPESLQEQ